MILMIFSSVIVTCLLSCTISEICGLLDKLLLSTLTHWFRVNLKLRIAKFCFKKLETFFYGIKCEACIHL